ncbi:TIR domain-containing protein [Brasilonema sp. UFV-L1]|uniref:WD40 domain-containing protein n=1 Tax=Brasilonema sp. UFV-L1 TaxID=2234130 RepID=UPI00145D0A78|nr:TIR domain-containing protein [Brasilonema sp. UFV-L1]NMG06043.1 hypothetical protein [Brasilonema sp. UFV-L1]
MLNHHESPSGWTLKHILRGHNGLISRVEWSPDGKMLASSSFDRTIKLWNIETGECCNTLKGHSGRVWSVAWSPDEKLIASGSADNTIRLWRVDTGEVEYKISMDTGICLSMAWSLDGQILVSGGMRDDWSIMFWNLRTRRRQTIEGHSGQVNSLAWSPDGQMLASGSHDSSIRLWDKETALLRILKGHSSDVVSVVWSPDGRMLASASNDYTIRLWNPQTGQTLFVLEGHTASVNCVEFSWDGKFLASKSSDGTVRLWRCDTWETVTVLEEPTYKSLPFGLTFHPQASILATLGEADIAIRIWKLDCDFLMNATPANPSSQYTNARVVLVGDTGVGKSGLSLVLTSQPFKPTESTHGRCVSEFYTEKVDLGDNRKEMREILLWDLAGQPGYRLIHQLYLNDLALALIVFDARSETDPFAGVYYWNRALRQAQNLQSNSAIPLKKLLVAGRADRGRISVSRDRINSLVRDLCFDGYFETSAKEGWQIQELAAAIRAAIDWNTLPKEISTELFYKIKIFLIQQKQAKRLLSPVDDLYRNFLESSKDAVASEELSDQFQTCIGLVESRGLIRKFSFGNLILLQPELLDAYASAIVNAAKDEPEGLGCIVEDDVEAGRFRMSEDERITDREQEKLLLIATVQELFSREIALRVQTEKGSFLVFPSQCTREWPEAPDPEGKAVIFKFEGPVLNIYTTLTVRLSRSEIFKRKELWKNAAIFEARVGGECGIWLLHSQEGRAELTLFFKPEASEETRFQFEEYVHTHLKRQALPESIRRRRIFLCPDCDTPVTELQAYRRQERGFDWINCSVCEHRVSLLDGEERVKANRTSIIPQMDKAANTQREIETAASIVKGKEETKDFDVFLAHNTNVEIKQVETLAKLLKQRGLNPWLAQEQIPPGRWFQDVIQQTIPNVKSAAIIISSQGLGKWQSLELRAFIRKCVEEIDVPVIPVLLPGVTTLPEKLLFLRELNSVYFTKNLEEDTQALDALEWGITGKPPLR